ncbi:BnaC05g32880D [Brassica napus]|uniref:BnaC05g32880D protein n=1 Tax=Brassica napus TaxID=3708 RepID=A0A078GH43_BRANA|nr:BnaC05g32880D [Brassica napus]
MSLLCYSSCVAPPFPQTKLSTPSFLKPKTRTLTLCSAIGYPNSITGIKKDISYLFTGPHKLPSLAKSQILVSPESFTANSTIDIDWEDQEDVEDTGSPWEGSSAGWMSTLFKDSQGRGWHSKALKDGKSDSHRAGG